MYTLQGVETNWVVIVSTPWLKKYQILCIDLSRPFDFLISICTFFSAILAGLFAYSAQPITRGLISQIVNADEQGNILINLECPKLVHLLAGRSILYFRSFQLQVTYTFKKHNVFPLHHNIVVMRGNCNRNSN